MTTNPNGESFVTVNRYEPTLSMLNEGSYRVMKLMSKERRQK